MDEKWTKFGQKRIENRQKTEKMDIGQKVDRNLTENRKEADRKVLKLQKSTKCKQKWTKGGQINYKQN